MTSRLRRGPHAGQWEASPAPRTFPFLNRGYRRGDQPLSLKRRRQPSERTLRAQPTRDGDDDVSAALSLAGREMDLPPDRGLKAKPLRQPRCMPLFLLVITDAVFVHINPQ